MCDGFQIVSEIAENSITCDFSRTDHRIGEKNAKLE